MQVKILFDKDATNKNLHIGWGVSFLIDGRILFDTGEKGDWLIENMKNLDVDIDKIEAVVISHDHWDHTGGLWELLKKKKGLTIYACPNFSIDLKKRIEMLKGKLIERKKVTKIAKNVFVTGEITGQYKDENMPEQGLIVKTENGITLITGCAHPGIVKMVKKVKERFPKERLYLVLGGFHLIDKNKGVIDITVERFKEMKVEKVGPTHCSGSVAEEIFKEKYGNNFVSVKTGQTFDI